MFVSKISIRSFLLVTKHVRFHNSKYNRLHVYVHVIDNDFYKISQSLPNKNQKEGKEERTEIRDELFSVSIVNSAKSRGKFVTSIL